MYKSQPRLTLLLLFFVLVLPPGGLPVSAHAIDQQPAAKSSGKGTKRGAAHPAKTQDRGLAPVDSPESSAAPGPYYALLIGNNNYRYVNKLQTAIGDAEAMAKALGPFGFITTVLRDATRDQVFTALTDYRRKLPARSNLLIYFAGHGILDRPADEAYWLPVDALADNPEHWISASDINSVVRAMASMHVLIISDSCYSGALMRSVEPPVNPQETAAYIKKMLASKSRNLMASGGVEPVADGGPGNHSIFASALLESLGAMDERQFTAGDLFQRFIKRGVAGRSRQVPEYSFIRNSGDEFGDFVFSRTNGGKPPHEPPPGPRDDSTPAIDDTTNSSKAGSGSESSAGWANETAINDLLRRYADAYNMRDADALWKIWPNSAKKTRDSIGSAFKSASSIKMNLTLRTPEISPDGQSAQVQGQFSQLFTPKEGSPQPVRNGDITFVIKKTNGVWTISDVK
jgi:uncharacterized caspase-like protein/ketosteroid isomerase-like protein